MQVCIVGLTDPLPNLWLEARSTNSKNLRQCIPCRGENYRTSVAGKYRTLLTQTICSVLRAVKIVTVIVSILIILPKEPRWTAQDNGAQKRSMLCNNIIPHNYVTCRPLMTFQCNWRLRLGSQGRKVNVYEIRAKHNIPCFRWNLKLCVVEYQSGFWLIWSLLITWYIYIMLPQAKYQRQKDCKW